MGLIDGSSVSTPCNVEPEELPPHWEVAYADLGWTGEYVSALCDWDLSLEDAAYWLQNNEEEVRNVVGLAIARLLLSHGIMSHGRFEFIEKMVKIQRERNHGY
jgi:hypothetical protein